MNHDDSFILFARPSYLSGAARTLDARGLFNAYNRCSTEWEADVQAIRSDWWAVGDDIRLVFGAGLEEIDTGTALQVLITWADTRDDDAKGMQLTLADA